jgi:arginine/ornithine N-succinyltransferase beta subunit
VDPFDGGPHYGAAFSRIRLVRRAAALRFRPRPGPGRGAARALVLAERGGAVRAVLSAYRKTGRTAALEEGARRALGLRGGERVTLVPFERSRL